MDDAEPWFAVRCLIRFDRGPGVTDGTLLYEERITLWKASAFEEAVHRAEAEARRYAHELDGEPVDFAQVFHLTVGDTLSDGAEVFSLMRASDLEPEAYIDRFFDTGLERQDHLD